MPNAFLDKNPDAAKGFVDALTEALKVVNKDPTKFQQIAARETGVPVATVKAAPVPLFTTAISRDTVARWTELMVKFDVLKSPVESSGLEDLALCGSAGTSARPCCS